jgi:predicted RND superfamily exporter protein
VLLVALLSLIPAAYATSRLELRTSFSELLPESRPSVIELKRVSQRLAGVSTLIVVIHSDGAESSKKCINELGPRLRELVPRYVTGVDDGTRALSQFVASHKYLYAKLSDLEALRDQITEYYDDEVVRRSGLDLGLVSDTDAPVLPDREALRAHIAGRDVKARDAIGDGYYLSEHGRLGAIVLSTPFAAGDHRALELEERIVRIFGELPTVRENPQLTLHFTGNLVTSVEESQAVVRDLAHVGSLGVLLIGAVVFLFFLRLRVLVLLLATLAAGCTWSFAAAYLAVGYLNSATGFLVSIIAGNGINFGIVLMARYLEARLRDRMDVGAALRVARNRTAAATLGAAFCAMVAYGSLAFSDFRGFRQFGMIAGLGMLLCWIASYSVLPSLIALSERAAPLRDDPRSLPNRLRALYGRPFAFAASRFPLGLVVIGLVTAALSTGLAMRYLAADPLEYDMTKIRNDAADPTSARQLARRVEKVVGRFSRDARALVTDRLDQVEPLVAELRRRRDASPGRMPFQQVVSVYDLLPEHQQQKIAIIGEVADRLRRARKLGAIPDTDWAKIEPEIPPAVRPIGIADLPRDIAWRFEEADSSRGRIVYLIPTEGRSLNDGHYLMEWADSFREVTLPNGEVVLGSGDPVIVADLLRAVREGAPRTLAAAVLMTLFVISVAFGGRRSGWLACASLVLGMLWLLAFFAVTGTRINFLNFVAIPITVGVGADYAVNVMKRYELEGHARLHRVLVETGGSLVLCSLTTLLGYASLTFSINGAVRSFGIAAAVGELAMMVAALLVLPAILFLRPKLPRRSLSPETL